MKKKLEAELISIAHRVLKLKNREETKQLQEEAKKLYEQLTILRFYEEHFEVLKADISVEALEAKLEKHVGVLEEELKETLHEIVEEPVFDEPILSEEKTLEKETIAEETIEEEVVQPALFDTIDVENYKEVDFVKVEEVPIEVEKVADLTFERASEPKEEMIKAEPVKEEVLEKIEPKEIEPAVVFEAKKEEFKKDVGEEEPRTMSLNDRLTKGIAFGLNDRIAFEKRLFGGNPDDFNRVVSQLNTFDSFEEARGFINDFVKPDYNNWDGKEEFENRFLEIIERKFN